jgi:hypothetical protein
MKKLFPLFTAVFIAGSLTTAALAYDDSFHQGDMKSTSEHGQTSVEAKFYRTHTMQGTIDNIDQSKGTVGVRTQDGTELTLHFPSDTLNDFKQGDHVAVKMRIKKEAGTAMNNK